LVDPSVKFGQVRFFNERPAVIFLTFGKIGAQNDAVGKILEKRRRVGCYIDFFVSDLANVLNDFSVATLAAVVEAHAEVVV
jgi:hypothetical protein